MNRRGFSLLEVLVALSLSLLLLGGIYAGLDLFWRFSTTGHEEVERAQIARAVLRQIELDLRSIVYQGTAESSETSGGSGTSGGGTGGTATGGNATGGAGGAAGSASPTGSNGTAAGGNTGSEGGGTAGTGGTTAGATPDSAGLVGDSVSIRFTTCSPSRRNEYVPLGTQVAGLSRSSDLLQVGYQLGDSTQGTGGVPTGLSRMEGDSLTLSQPQNSSNPNVLASNLQLVAAEVTNLTFSYFDGYNWRSDWDSAVLGGLPLAVEVAVEVTTPPRGSRPGSPAASRDSKSQTFRIVTAIPLAKATDTSTIQ